MKYFSPSLDVCAYILISKKHDNILSLSRKGLYACINILCVWERERGMGEESGVTGKKQLWTKNRQEIFIRKLHVAYGCNHVVRVQDVKKCVYIISSPYAWWKEIETTTEKVVFILVNKIEHSGLKRRKSSRTRRKN